MTWLNGPILVASAVLVTAGLGKLREPKPLGAVFDRYAVPRPQLVARIIGLTELAIGVYYLLFASTAGSLLVAAIYGTFGVGLAILRAGDGRAESCGCLGAHSRPPSVAHIAAVGVVTALSILGAYTTLYSLPDALRMLGGLGIPFVITLSVSVAFVYALMNDERHSRLPPTTARKAVSR